MASDRPVKQLCATCVHSSKCWPTHTNKGKTVSTQNILININICRLQLGIKRDDAVRNLLQILRPGMVRLISHARQTSSMPGLDMDQLLLDMQSMAIEYLLYDYKIGDRGRATPYLFNPQQGFLIKWLKWTIGKSRRFYSHHELYDPVSESTDDDCGDQPQYMPYASMGKTSETSWSSVLQGGDSMKYDPYNDAQAETFARYQTILDIIEDGITLNSNEYRVIKFCMTNGNELNTTRHIDGLHIYLAKLMGVSRPRITRLYKRSQEKLRRKCIATFKEVD